MMLFLLNARAGSGGAVEVRHEIGAACVRAGLDHALIDLDEHPLEELTDTLFRARIIVVVGGDGTVASVASRLAGFRGALAVYPFGTGNDFARELGFFKLARSSSVEEYVRRVGDLSTLPFRVWRVQDGGGDRHFINYLSVGFDGVVISRFAENRYDGGLLGALGVTGNRIRYIRAGLGAQRYRLPPVRLISEEGVARPGDYHGSKCMLFTNIRSIMGLGCSNTVSCPDDERCECLAVRSIGDYLRMLAAGMLGTTPPPLLGSSSKWELGFYGVLPAQIDGEAVTVSGPSLTIVPAHSINVLAPGKH